MTRWQYMIDAVLIIILLILIFFNIIGLFRVEVESDSSFHLDRASLPASSADAESNPQALQAGSLPARAQVMCLALFNAKEDVSPLVLIVFILVMLILFAAGGSR